MVEALKIIIVFVFYTLDVLVVLYGAYFLIMSLFAFKKRRVIRSYKAKHKLAVLIAARNESKVIGNLIDSLKKQKYPKELYDIFVIPNNCTDNTEEVAKAAGAKIIKCKLKLKSKGEVLKFAFEYMKTKQSIYEAYVIFDADNIVHNNFMLRMNDVMCAGYLVAQGYRDSKNPYDSWISSSYSLLYLLQNVFINKARTNIGISSFINGTGFMVAKEVIDKIGFENYTLTEDTEFASQCALNGIKIGFVDDATTYDEQPVKFVSSWKQRIRWSTGMLQCMKIYFWKLFKTGIKNKSLACIDMALFYIAPVVQVLQLLVLGIFGLLVAFNIGTYRVIAALDDTKIYSLIIGYLFFVIVSILVLLMEKKNVIKSIKGIFTFYLFIMTWVPITIICFFKKNQVWDQIDHTRSVNIEKMEK